MARSLLSATIVTAIALGGMSAARAANLPSFLQGGDSFCTNQADFDDLVTHGHVRAGSAIETCITVSQPTRVAVMGGQGGTKAMVLMMNGPYAYSIGWTNGKLPLAK